MHVLAAAAQEQAVPGWVIAVALAVPAVIMLLVLRWAVRGRARQGRHRRAERGRRGGDALARGSAAGIADGGEYKPDALLRALSIKPEDHGPDDKGNPHDEGWGDRPRPSASPGSPVSRRCPAECPDRGYRAGRRSKTLPSERRRRPDRTGVMRLYSLRHTGPLCFPCRFELH